MERTLIPYIQKISVVCEYLDVFPEKFPELPAKREIEFFIELVWGVQPISKATHTMAPTELAELKKQLQELIEKDSSVSPWSTLILFVEKKDRSMPLYIN